jgi:hypothetical protein
MKTNWIRTLTLSAAALTMVSGLYAQSRLVAEIPFSFRINGTEMPAGQYRVEALHSEARVVYLTDGHNRKMVMGINAGYGDTKEARLIFSCRESSGCTLAQVWDGTGKGLEFPKPKMTSAEKERLAVVVLHRSEAE